MPILIPWTTVEIGDIDVFAPALPSLVVYTWYVDNEPESTVTYFWRDENTGLVHHEIVHVGPASFEAAVAKAREEAPKRGVERIHVKHARGPKKPATKAKTTRTAKAGGRQAKKGNPVKRKAAAAVRTGRRKQPI